MTTDHLWGQRQLNQRRKNTLGLMNWYRKQYPDAVVKDLERVDVAERQERLLLRIIFLTFFGYLAWQLLRWLA